MRLNARQLRDVPEGEVEEAARRLKRRPMYFILENIYDTYNVGGLFRLADALAISKIYLVGATETPPNPRIKKASIGTYKVVPWSYAPSAAEAIAELRASSKSQTLNTKQNSLRASSGKLTVMAIEQHSSAVTYPKANYAGPVALVLGNETYGVTPETLKLCDQIIEIPMWGINKSLNVIVSAAIVAYHAVSNQEVE